MLRFSVLRSRRTLAAMMENMMSDPDESEDGKGPTQYPPVPPPPPPPPPPNGG